MRVSFCCLIIMQIATYYKNEKFNNLIIWNINVAVWPKCIYLLVKITTSTRNEMDCTKLNVCFLIELFHQILLIDFLNKVA